MKKILFMRSYFFPEIAASNQMCLEFIMELAKSGYEITILCPTPSRGLTIEQYNEYKKKKIERLAEKVVIKRFWLPKESKNILLRGIRYIIQNIYQFFYGLTHSYDLLFLYSTPPTNGLIGSLLRYLKKKPFVYYLHDIFPDSMLKIGIIKNKGFIWKIGRSLENFSYKYSNKIITLSNKMAENIKNKGVNYKKIEIVYNWIDPNNIKYIDRENNSLIKDFKIDPQKFIVTYAGNIGEAQSIETLIKAAKLIENDKEIFFVIIGNGTNEKKCKEMSKDLENIIFIPMQKKEKVSEVYSLGDISTIFCKKGFGDAGMPSKLGSILATNRIVLASFDKNSDLADLLNKEKVGICVEAENEIEIVKAIYEIKNNQQYQEIMKKNAKEFLEKNMTLEKCSKKLIKIIEKTIEG